MKKGLFSQNEINTAKTAVKAQSAKEVEKKREKLQNEENAKNRQELFISTIEKTKDFFILYAKEFPALARECGYEARRFLSTSGLHEHHFSEPMYQILSYDDDSDGRETMVIRNNGQLYITPQGSLVWGRVTGYRDCEGDFSANKYTFCKNFTFENSAEWELFLKLIYVEDVYTLGGNSQDHYENLQCLKGFLRFIEWSCQLASWKESNGKEHFFVTRFRSDDEIEKRIKQHFLNILSLPVKGFSEEQIAEYHSNQSTEINHSNSTGGCYVATSVYGSYDCPPVWTLRRYRDTVLATTWYGRWFIKFYYTISPLMVRCFGQTKWFKRFWYNRLDRFVKKLNDSGIDDAPYID